MSGGRTPNFAGWEAPPQENDLAKVRGWRERLEVQRDFYDGKWAKYGPYSNEKSLANRATQLRSLGRSLQMNVLIAHSEDEEGWWLHIKIRKRR